MKIIRAFLFTALICLSHSAYCQQPSLSELFGSLGFDLTWKEEIRLKGPMQGLFAKTAKQVEIVPIAKMGESQEEEQAAIQVGYYSFSKPDRLRKLFECNQKVNGESQVYGIPSRPGGPYSFQPGAEPFGLYIQPTAFDDGPIRTHNKPNQTIKRFGMDVRKARIFPYRIHGQVKNGWYVIAWEASTNNDYQDLVIVVRGVRLIETKSNDEKPRRRSEGEHFT